MYRDAGDAEISGRLNSRFGGIFKDDTKYDFIDLKKEEKGYYFCQPLPAGKYEFYSFEYYNYANGGSGYYLDEEKYFKLPVQVGPREVVNIGGLKLTTSRGDNMFGIQMYGPGVLQLTPLSDNDVQQAMAKCPKTTQSVASEKQLYRTEVKHPLIENVKY